MPTWPVPSANSVGSDIQLRTTFAVPSVKSQPNPRPLAQPMSAITATDTAVSDPPATRNALNVPPQRQASAIATKPSASSDGSLTCEDIVISTTPSRSIGQRQPSRPFGAAVRPSQRSWQQRPGGVDAAQRELGARQHQAQHQRLVVDARDQMHEQQRVRRAQPHRAHLGDPATAASRGVAQTIRPTPTSTTSRWHNTAATMFSPVSAEMP